MDNVLIKRFEERVQSVVPGYKVVQKKDSVLMRFLGSVLFFVPGFMNNYCTTLGNTVYLTDRVLADTRLDIIGLLGHEAQHVFDKQHFFLRSLGYGFWYLLPQILALGAVFAVLSVWFGIGWLWCLTLIALLAPLPAYGRMRIEYRGYLMSLLSHVWLHETALSDLELKCQLKQFTGPAYYFMWPFLSGLMKRFRQDINAYKHHASLLGPVYEFVFNFIQEEKRKHKQLPSNL